MPHIGKVEFGNMEIDGKNFGSKDLYVWWDGNIEERVKSHEFSARELSGLLRKKDFDVLIVATGFYGVVKVEESAITLAKNEGKEVLIFTTPKACEVFNELVKEGKRVLLVLHSTC